MSSVNKVIVMGHLGKDPEVRYSPSGSAVANFSLATSEQFKDRDGNKQERTEWHRVVLFGRTAEIAGEYLRKGRMAYVEGRLQTRKWTDKDGQDRYTTEIVGERLQLIGGREQVDGGEEEQRPAAPSKPSAPRQAKPSQAPASDDQPPAGNFDFEDDIPF